MEYPEFAFYHPSVGVWICVGEPTEAQLADHPDGSVEIPLPPSAYHTFNGSEWVAPTQEMLEQFVGDEVRSQRNARLFHEVDPLVTNPLRWADMTTAEQNAWSQYRTDLLNITDQAGFPHNITWPTKP